jgi:N6-adenosine-specific RNA methylase IME4
VTVDTPDVIHGRMKEGAHIAGYSLQRAMENLRWLLDGSRYEQLASGYKNVNDFLRDTQDAFKLLNIKPEERKQIAELVKELQPKASQRAIGDLMGVSPKTIGADLGVEYSTPKASEQVGIVENSPPPAIPPDDYDPTKVERVKQNAEKRRKERADKINEISKGNGSLNTEIKYPIIYADPPWQYEHSKTDNRKIENQYPTMSLNEICEENVDELATPDAVLFLWATSPKLDEAMRVIEAWGFTYRTNMVWVKDKIGMGYYARQQHELLLIATRGNVPVPEPENRVSSVIHSPRLEHSEKPERFYEIIEEMYPEYSKKELFSRKERDGWDAWGNQV